jgi:hypothetical protein
VFVASAKPGRDTALELTITRYRELAGSLGEGARIVTGLPFQADALAPLSIDGDGLLYVALPAPVSSRASAPRDRSAGGAILRFKNDGTVPPGNWRGSPVIARGYAQPTGLAIDTVSERLWLAGQDPVLGDSVSTVPLTDAPTLRVPRLDAVTSIALLPKSTARRQPWLLVSSRGQLLRGIVDSNGGVDAFSPLTQEGSMSLRAVAEGPEESLYAVTGATELSIVRLVTQ